MRRATLYLLAFLLISCARQTAKVDDYSKQTRFPDDEGTVTAVDFEDIQIDGSRKHPIRPDVQSFSTYTGKITPLLGWMGKYVHVGLDHEGRTIWIAGIGVVIDATDRPTVLYLNGELLRVDSQNRAIFRDGTVLRLDRGVTPPSRKKPLKATIDPARHVVVELAEQ